MEPPLPHDDLTAQLLALRPDVARRVARRRRGGRTEDKTQEAMLIAHRRLGTYCQGIGGLRPWVLGIASNVERNYRRAERRYKAVFCPDLGDAEKTPAPGPSPERQAQLREARAKLTTAIQDMPGGLLIALILVCVEGASMKDVGEELGISEAAAKTRVHRARLYLRERLKGYEDDLLTVVPPGLLGENADEEFASTTGGLFDVVFPGGHLWSGIMVAVLLFQPDAILTAQCGLEPIARGLPPLHALAGEASSRTASSPDPSAAPIVEPPTPYPARAPSAAPRPLPKPSPTTSTLDVALEELGRIPVNGQ